MQEPAAGFVVGGLGNTKKECVHNPRWPYFRECVTWAIVIGGHALLFVLFLRADNRHDQTAEADSENRSVLFLELTPPVDESPTEKDTLQKDLPQRSAAGGVTQTPASDSITVPTETPPAKPAIDWYREAEEVGLAAAEKGASQPRGFGEQPTSPYKTCKKRKPQFDWDPEPKKAGIEGGLPYVRLGKRCVLGLGFFGCALGKLPEANGQLFENMDDPNRPRDSVPDDGCGD